MKQLERMRGHLRQTGQIVSDPAILIATTALYHDLTLLTHNMRHFRRVPDLKLYQTS